MWKRCIFQTPLWTDILSAASVIGRKWGPETPFEDKSIFIQVKAFCYQATSYCLSQCWLKSMSLAHSELITENVLVSPWLLIAVKLIAQRYRRVCIIFLFFLNNCNFSKLWNCFFISRRGDRGGGSSRYDRNSGPAIGTWTNETAENAEKENSSKLTFCGWHFRMKFPK